MFGYKSKEVFGLYINFYKETGVSIYRLRYEDLIREAVDSGVFPKSYKSKFEHKLKFASMPRDGAGREIFKQYKERLPNPPRDLRSELDRYFINWLIAAGKVSQKSGFSFTQFLNDRYDIFDFGDEEEIFDSYCFSEASLFDEAGPTENIKFIERPEYRSLAIGIKDSCELIGAKYDKEAFDLACKELINVNRPKFAMGAFLFDEYIKHENPPQEIRRQLDSVIIDSMFDRLGELNIIFKNINFDNIKGQIINRIEELSVIDGKFVKSKGNQFDYEKSKKIADLFPNNNFHTEGSISTSVNKKSTGQCPFCFSNDTKRISQIIDEGVSSSIGIGVSSSGAVGVGIGFSKTGLAKKSQKLKTIQFNESRNGYNKRQAEQLLISALLAGGMTLLLAYMLHDRADSSATFGVAMLVLLGVTYFSLPVLFERYRNIDYFGEHYVREVKIDFWQCLRCGKHWDENK